MVKFRNLHQKLVINVELGITAVKANNLITNVLKHKLIDLTNNESFLVFTYPNLMSVPQYIDLLYLHQTYL